MALWYVFTRTSGANPNDPTNYAPGQSTPPGCPGSTELCAILANDNGFGYPLITAAIQTAISNAEQSGQDSSTVLLRSM